MRAVVVAAAGQVDHSLCPHMNKADLLVAADGGAAAMLELGFVPHAVVGDFDSLSPEVASRLAECGSEFVRVQREDVYKRQGQGLRRSRPVFLLLYLGGKKPQRRVTDQSPTAGLQPGW